MRRRVTNSANLPGAVVLVELLSLAVLIPLIVQVALSFAEAPLADATAHAVA